MNTITRDIVLRLPEGALTGHLRRPEFSSAIIVVAQTDTNPAPSTLTAALTTQHMAVLEIDLLTAQELHFHSGIDNTARLAQRLISLLDFIRGDGDTEGLPVGIYAADHASPAAIRAAAQRDTVVQAVVARGGLIDRAGRQYLESLAAPLLVLIDNAGQDETNATQRAFQYIHAPHEMQVIANDQVAEKSADWFRQGLA